MGNTDSHGTPRPGLPPGSGGDAGPEWAACGSVPSNRVSSGAGRPLFAEDGVADVMPPSPFLAALTEQAVGDLAALTDNELVGVLRATQRQIAREGGRAHRRRPGRVDRAVHPEPRPRRHRASG
jgi:hypothetical protein